VADPTAPIAFLAGLASFLSPCVLPLVPGYLSYMTGVGTAAEGTRRRAVLITLAFVLGFTAVFVALGTTATFVGWLLHEEKPLLVKAAGVAIILLGLAFMGVLRAPLLYREARWRPSPGPGAGGGFVLGCAFAFGWTPCVGTTMAAVLAMAAGRGATGGPAQGAALLALYSLGLGVPFVVAGLAASRLPQAVGALTRHARAINVGAGLLLVAVGTLFLTDGLFHVSLWMQRGFTALNLDRFTAL
jgi:cytochrome c-type biogenesis protein